MYIVHKLNGVLSCSVLSVWIRGLLSLLFLDTHIKQIFSTCFSYIKNIIKLRCTVSNEELKILNNASILLLIDSVIHYFPHSMNLPWISCRWLTLLLLGHTQVTLTVSSGGIHKEVAVVQNRLMQGIITAHELKMKVCTCIASF